MGYIETNPKEPTEFMLTTVDNPFNPFTQFDEWYAYDTRLGYGTLALLGRITFSSDEISEPDQVLATTQAMDEIVAENVSGMWRKVSRKQAESLANNLKGSITS